MALALYRRYRPDTFDGVIGQDQVTVPLMRALVESNLKFAGDMVSDDDMHQDRKSVV